MDPYECTLNKLPSGKTKAIVVRECPEEKNWSTEEQNFKTPMKVLAERKAIVDSLEIKDSFSKVICDHSIYSKEEYIKLLEREDKYWKDKGTETGIKKIFSDEIAIVKLHLSPERWNLWNLNNNRHEVMENDEIESNLREIIVEEWQAHL
jgi:hypothetical protein